MVQTIFLLHILFVLKVRTDDLFMQDLSEDMKIPLAETGFKSVKLKCGSNSMMINLETDEDFSGVIYTRGSYYDKESPCFLDAIEKKQRVFSIKFPFDKCNTVKKGETYSNVLVLQYDKDLIMPGDAAFNLECDFEKPRDVTVSASFEKKTENKVVSKIFLTNADPGASNVNDKKNVITSQSSSVIITPEKYKRRKEEL